MCESVLNLTPGLCFSLFIYFLFSESTFNMDQKVPVTGTSVLFSEHARFLGQIFRCFYWGTVVICLETSISFNCFRRRSSGNLSIVSTDSPGSTSSLLSMGTTSTTTTTTTTAARTTRKLQRLLQTERIQK